MIVDLDPNALLGAATNLSRVHATLSGLTSEYDQPLVPMSVQVVTQHVSAFRVEAENLGARLAVLSAERLLKAISAEPCTVTVANAALAINEIESRFADHVTEVKLLALYPQQAAFLSSADELIEFDGFAERFPKGAFEIEEAAKCLAYGRSTAAVFHAMRLLEIGIYALSKRLGLEDPVKTSEKNWATILRKIKAKIDEKWPSNKRLPGTDGAAFEKLYAQLDAVRNPWRNATMHVENTYQPHEALHILRCSAFFMKELSELATETGLEPEIAEMLG